MDCLNDTRAEPSYGSLVSGFNGGHCAGALSLHVRREWRGYQITCTERWISAVVAFFYETAMAHVPP
jgi:hypothetical protein